MLDSEKYKAAVHYIIASCDDPIKLGSIKLNKILFYSDSDMFFNTGKSITNDEYIKRQFGPVPKNILEILKELEDEKKIAIQKCAPEADGAVPFYKETSGYIAAKINNGDFIHTVSKMMNWQLDKAGYKCLGDAYPDEGVMIFDLSSAVKI